MSAELSLAEADTPETEDFWSYFNESVCDIPELENITELQLQCLMRRGSAGTPSLPTWVMTVIQIFYALVCLAGLVGNSLVIYVVLRFSKMHTVTNTYILHLAVADECFLFGIPFLIATMSLKQWPFGMTMCKIYFTTTSINQITSSLFLMVLSADRYVAVCHPISSPRFRTGVIAKIVSLSVWLISALLMLPVFLYATTTTRQGGATSCNIYWAYNSWDNSSNSSQQLDRESILNEQTAFTFYSLIFGFLGPLAFILIFYVLVIIKLRSVGPRGQERSQSKRKSHRKVTKLVLTVITVYIICWLPHWVTQIALINQPPGYNQGNTLVIVILLSDCLQYSNSAINPVLYAFLSDNFKKSFRKACHCDKREVTGGLGHIQDCSATTRRSRRGPRFTAVPAQESNDEDKEGGDLSTGITFASRSSKYNCSSSSSMAPDREARTQVMTTNVVNGNLAPPPVM